MQKASPDRTKKIILFTDLDDNVKSKSQELINLKDVEVIVLYVGHDKDEFKFLSKVRKWENIFKKAGATKIEIYDPLLSESVEIL